MIDRKLRPCPLDAYRAEASPTRPHFLLARKTQAIVLSTAMNIEVDVAVARPGDHPYWQWLPSGNAFLHFPGWGCTDGTLTIFAAEDGSTITQVRLDSEDIVPFEPQPLRVNTDGELTLRWSDAAARKQCPPQWSTAYSEPTDSTLYLRTERPEGEPFLVKPPPPSGQSGATHPLIVSLDIAMWVLSKITGEEIPKPKQIPPHLRCKTREEWVGARLKET